MRRANARAEFNIVRKAAFLLLAKCIASWQAGLAFSKARCFTKGLSVSPLPKSLSAASFSLLTKSL